MNDGSCPPGKHRKKNQSQDHLLAKTPWKLPEARLHHFKDRGFWKNGGTPVGIITAMGHGDTRQKGVGWIVL